MSVKLSLQNIHREVVMGFFPCVSKSPIAKMIFSLKEFAVKAIYKREMQRMLKVSQ